METSCVDWLMLVAYLSACRPQEVPSHRTQLRKSGLCLDSARLGDAGRQSVKFSYDSAESLRKECPLRDGPRYQAGPGERRGALGVDGGAPHAIPGLPDERPESRRN